jgi:hypothetical protein
MLRRAKTISLLRVVDLLQAHITPGLCQTVVGAVRRTERQRMWTLEALIRVWTAVVLRAPKALTQAMADSLEGAGTRRTRGSRPVAKPFFSAVAICGRRFLPGCSTGSPPAW